MQATVPLSRLNITLYSVERRAINNVEKCAYFPSVESVSLESVSSICHGIAPRRAFLFPLPPLLERREIPPDRYVFTTRHEESACICIGRVCVFAPGR